MLLNNIIMKEEKEEPRNNGAEALKLILGLISVGFMIYVLTR